MPWVAAGSHAPGPPCQPPIAFLCHTASEPGNVAPPLVVRPPVVTRRAG